MNAALTASGVSGGDVLRCPMLALAIIARYGVKFHLALVQQESLDGGCMHLPRVEDVVESPDPPESW